MQHEPEENKTNLSLSLSLIFLEVAAVRRRQALEAAGHPHEAGGGVQVHGARGAAVEDGAQAHVSHGGRLSRGEVVHGGREAVAAAASSSVNCFGWSWVYLRFTTS